MINLTDEESFDSENELHFFRVLQEGINNAIRHGKADYISIQLKSYFHHVFFKVYDNGMGFEIKNENINGLGTKHMLERCRILEGDLRWFSKWGGA
ncbi:hypothetical protein CVD25_08605 [Bacillus canaveralius]|uniref:Histidine kinase/HSP90-like ATPase domain-containing protein n=1 Tax=Bacillus canaveralius TaxID=1403243 RepID=A0A2N5GL37_9BACI|nr:hypothetical protein CU635_13735 [Bacillus canaveralius]PLR97878.1 hypothetical protein CVD25_08605 [Bacillus canaveralius]